MIWINLRNSVFSLALAAGILFFAEFAKASLVDLPEHCLKQKSYPCAVRADFDGDRLITDRADMRFSVGSGIQMNSASELKVLDGAILVMGAQDLSLAYGGLLLRLRGDFLISHNLTELKLRLSNLDGQMVVQRGKLLPEEVVPAGYANWFGGIATGEFLSRGVIQPYQWKEIVQVFARLTKSRSLVEEKLARYRPHHLAATQDASDFYREVVSRRVASIEENEQRHQRAREQEKERARYLKRLFRQKNGLE